MSSFKKRQKTLKRAHKERHQLESRQHLGLLEKHKDYVLRARDYEKKKRQLKRLHEKARNRNPDEFYYKMINTGLKDGRHVVAQEEEKHSNEELLLMNTQDQKYVQMKLTSETRKVERLRSSLHSTRHQCNTHTIFVDSPEEATQKAALLQKKKQKSIVGMATMKDDEKDTASLYKELKSRSKRCRDLEGVCAKLKTKRDLMDKRRCVKLKGNGKPVYKWKMERLK